MEATFGFLLFDKVQELDLVGPWEMITQWSEKFSGPNQVVTVSQDGGTVKCAQGLRVVADFAFNDCPALDYLLVPGGMGTRKEVDNPIIIEFIRKQADHCQQVLSVCTGSFLLQAAGLLNNRTVTTHWNSIERLKQFKTLTVSEKRFVKDGNIWTSAGISAGIDMSLAFIADIAGREVAGNVQLQTEYFPSEQQYIHLDNSALPGYLKAKNIK